MRRVLRSLARVLTVPIMGLAALAAVPTPAAAQVDLVLNLSDAPDPVPAGGIITYSVTVGNDEVLTASGVEFSLDVPGDLKWQGYAGVGVACSGMNVGDTGPGTVTCTLPDIAFLAAVPFSIELKTIASGLVSIDAQVSSLQADLLPGNNSLTEQTTVTSGANVSLALSAPASAASGSTVSFGIVVNNAGPDPASELEVQFPIPTGFSVAGGLPGGCASAGGTITCAVPGPIASLGSLNVGSFSGQITVASGSTVTGVASVGLSGTAPLGTPKDPDTTDNNDVKDISITQGSDMRLTKARSTPGPYFIGESFDFVLTASYTGDPPNTMTITDAIPVNYSIGAVTTNQNGWTCGVSIQTVTCQRLFGGIAGENQPLGTITIPVTVAASGAGVVNSATIGALLPADPNPGNNTATDGGASLQDPVADLEILKGGPSPALVVVGVPFDYTLSVRNGGPFDFEGTLEMTDQVPVGLTVTSFTENGWSCLPAGPITGPGVLTCTRTYTAGSPFGSGVTTPTVVLNTTATAAGPLTNTAVLTTVNPNVADPDLTNNTVDRGVTADLPPDAADIRVLKSVDLATVPAGDILTYTLEIVNDGPVASAAVALTDNLGTLVNNLVGATGSGYIDHTISLGNVAGGDLTCSTASTGGSSRRLTCDVVTLPVCTAGSTCPTIDVRIRPGGNGGNRSNTVSVISTATADPLLTNNNQTISSTILPRADVTVTKTGSPDPATAGQELVYVVAARNNGPSQAGAVTITDLLPTDVIFLSAVPAAGSCSVTPGAGVVTTGGNRTVTCNLGTIGNGSQRTVTIRVKPTNATRGLTITNDVSVTTTTTEPDPPGNTNNATSVDVDVQNPDLDLVVNKDDDVDPLAVGDISTYEIEVENIGPSDAENVVITDDLPASGLSFQAYTISNGACGTVPAVDAIGAQLICTVARMAGGESTTITVDMKGVLKGAHTNTVTVASDETGFGFEGAGNNVATENTTVRTKADLEVVSVTATPDTIGVRRPFTWTLHIRNNVGPALAEADDVEVTNNLPTNVVLTGNPTVNVTVGTASTTTCTGAAGDTGFTCDLGTVSPGGEVEITVPVRSLVVPAGATRTNSASVTTFSLDVNPGNNANSGVVVVEGSSLSGTVFRDFANTGTIDVGDTGISGISMSLTGTAFDASPVTGSATTDGSGAFTFDELPDGTYTIQRGAVAETYLVTGQQIVGDRGGDATVVPEISGIALGEIDTGTGNLFAFIPRPRVGISKRALGLPVLQADSSFVIELRLVVENFSLEAMATAIIEDPLFGAPPSVGSFVPGGAGAALSLGTYAIHAAPTFVGACANGSINGGFDGESDVEMATIAPLAVGGSCEISFTLRFLPVVPLPPGGYTNSASVDGTGALSGDTPSDVSQDGADPDPDGDNDPTDNNVPTTMTPVLIADVTAVLDFPSPVDAGEFVSGTVLFRNDGPYQAEGVTYGLTLDPNLDDVTVLNFPFSATWSYEPTTGVVTFTGLPALLHAEEVASLDGISGITIRYRQTAVATSDISSAITTTTDQGANVLQDLDAVTVIGGLIADVTTTLSFPAFAPPGNTVRGDITFRNRGPSIASDVTYALTLHSGLSGVSFANLPVGASAIYDGGTGIVTFAGMPATVAPDVLVSGDGADPIRLEYIQHVSALTTVTSETGTSTNQGRNTGPDTATATIVGTVTIGIAKAATLMGDTVIYEIKIENAGTAPVESLSVLDELDSVFGAGNFVVLGMPAMVVAPATGSVTLNAGYTGTAGNPELIDQGSPATNILPVGENAVIQLQVQVLEVTDQGNGVGVFLNSSTLTAMGPAGTGPFTDVSVDGVDVDPDGNGDPSDDESPTPITLPVDATIGIAKQASVVGSRVTFDLTLVNSGNATATAVSIQDDLDAVFGAGNYTVATAPFFLDDSGTLALNGAFTGAGAGSQLLDPAMAMTNTLARGDTASLRFEVDIIEVTDRGNGLGVYENQAITSAMGPDGSTGPYVDWSTDGIDPDPDSDGDPTNNSVPTPFNLPMADLALEKVGPATALVGDTISYTLTITNAGPGIALDVQIQDALPTGVSFLSASDGGTHTAGVVSWPAVSELQVNASLVRTVEVEISEVGAWENVGSVTSSLDPDPTNNDGTAPENKTTVTTALALADLAVVKSGPTNANVGETLTYIITTTNLGPDGARNVVVVDSLPAGVDFLAGSRGAVATGRHVEWPALPLLAKDELVVDTITVSAPDAGIFTNVAQATSDIGDPNPGNNDGSDENSSVTTSVGAIDLSLEKSITSELKTGETATWEMVVRNLGTLPTTGPTTVVDQLPAGLTFVSSSGPGFVCTAQGLEVTCTYDEVMDPGSVWTFTLMTQVDAPAGVMLVNVATVSTPDEDSTANNNTASTQAMEVVGDGELVLEKSVAAAAVEVGDLVRYELLLRNVGLGTAKGVSIKDQLPRGFFLVSGSVVMDGESVPDPVGAPGPELSFPIGDVAVGAPIRLSYTLRVGVGADMGEQVNVAQAQDETGEISSNVATATVEIRLGVFTDLGHILGRVWVEVSDSTEYDSQGQRDRFDPTLGVAGVRVYLQDGTSAVTDALGRYSFTDLRPRQWVVRVDERTLPPGMVLQRITSRHMGEGSSRFVDLTRGEMARADFGDTEADTLLYKRVQEWAEMGSVPEIAVPSQLAMMGAGSMTRGSTGWRSQNGMNGRVSNLGQRPGVAPWKYGAGGAGGSSLLSRGTMAPLFSRPGSTSGMALDPSADRYGGQFVTGLNPEDSEEGQRVTASQGLRMLISGFIEGRFDARSLTDGELFQGGARDRFQDALLEISSISDDGKQIVGGRAAAFATGEVGDGYQLTLRLDTEKDPTRRFFNDIRPDEMYDVFGDASSTLFEAQSKGRFFGALSKGGSYLMYGDYNTASYDAAQLLGRYSRTLNGVLHQYDSERVSFKAFASRDSFRQIVDEIPAIGISGPYQLSKPDGLMNSERVEVIVRDRNQPALILDIVPMERFTDYTIEPFTGRIIFKRPVPSLDEGLNPISIRVTYESETGGDSFWVGGADARVAAGDHISLGAGFVRDDAPGSRYDLFSANAGITLGEGTWINGELAQSDSAGVQDGTAWRVEMRHASQRLDFRGYYLTTDSTFQNTSAGVGVGRTEMGLNGGIKLADGTSFLGEAIRSVDDRTEGTLTGGRVALLQRLGAHVTGQVGYRYASQEGAVSGPGSTMEDVSALGGRLEVGSAQSLTLFGEYEQDIADSEARRLAVGGDIRIMERMRLYGRHELLSTLQGPYTMNRGQDRNATVFGVSADYREGQSVFSEYRVGNGMSGRGAHAAIGLRNQWEVSEGVRLNTTFERVSPMDSVGGGDVLAVTGGLEITSSPFWKGTMRAEYRATDAQDHVLGTVGFARRVSDEVTLLAQSVGSKILDGGAFYERTRIGLAYRSGGSKGLNALARYEHRTDENSMAAEGPRDHKAHIFSTHVNLRPVDRFTFRGQWAAKYATDEVAGMTVEQAAQLVSGRATLDLTKRFDIGGTGRAHMGEGRTQFGLGVDLGLTLGGGMRLGVGYNWFGFTDEDLSLDEYTDKGFYIDLGLRFDESLFGFGDDDRQRVGESRRH